ncbi:MAG: radical SAM family heme chaperone HemW [candidate division Zixibacteria bacterium]|nr:radical SAM family heme chaperone HemW [candidate division Zixibacteria bacterium]
MQFALYLHYPFCRNMCSYCDFYKTTYDRSLEKKFFRALKIETELASENSSLQKAIIGSIFIGGGTPSLVNLDLLADWLSVVHRHFDVADGVEFTVENNPESVTLEMLKGFKDLGVNRPVFGIQSFNTKSLRLLGRKHNPDDSRRAIYYTNALGFGNFGVDFIFGLPGQNSTKFSFDLDQVIDLCPPHISFYQLTVEKNTKLAREVDAGRIKLPNQELSLGFYKGGCEKMADEGYLRYEVSSFAKPGFECRHNLRYWEGDNFLGLGPSAHSFVDGQRFANMVDVEQYIEALTSGILPRAVDESGVEERMIEAIMLGLRTSRGISCSEFAERFGTSLENMLDREQYAILVESGHLLPDGGILKLSDEGIYLADEITRRLLK